MGDHLQDVVIIGAGLGGCALALAFAQRNIPVRIYESRPLDSPKIPSGVILTPNGLRILDRLGVLPRIKPYCYLSTHRVFKNAKDETVRKVHISGPPLYEYANHRVWRSILLDQMKQMLTEQSIEIEYSSRFESIVEDNQGGVDFLINGKIHHASLLVGMDGIHSQVRQYLAPDVVPTYMGTTGVLSHIKRASVDWPYDDYEWNATIQDKPGAIFFIAEDANGEDIMIGKQQAAPEYSREELEDLQNDKDKLVAFYTENYDEWCPTARKIIDQVVANKKEAFIWPFVKVPTLSRWYSDTGRVLLCGDGAHGLPPSSGQGINMALEDVYSLMLLLECTSDRQRTIEETETSNTTHGQSRINLVDALQYWQSTRQQRVDAVADWATNIANVARMSEAERQKLMAGRKATDHHKRPGDDMRWLFEPKWEADLQDWIATRS